MAVEQEIAVVIRATDDGFKPEVIASEEALRRLKGQAEDTGAAGERSGRRFAKFGDGISSVNRRMASFDRTILTLAGVSLPLLAGASVKAFAAIDSGLIGVQKTTGLTDGQINQLETRLTGLTRTLPVTLEQLLANAQVAGQLGIKGVDDISQFAATFAQLELASNLAGEAGATSLAKIIGLTGETVDNTDRLGAAIVQMGNNFKTTEAEIVGTAQRVAQSVALYDVAAEDVVALATALEQLGINPEAGGTQIGLFLQNIDDALRNGGPALELIEQLTGQNQADLSTRFFGDDAVGVFKDLIDALGGVGDEGGNVIALLQELGLDGVRAAQVIGTLAKQNDVLTDTLNQSRQAYQDNVALTDEVAAASRSFENQMKLVRSAVSEAAVTAGGELAPVLLELAGEFRDVTLAAVDSGAVKDFAQDVGDGLRFIGQNLDVVEALAGGYVAARVGAVALTGATAILNATMLANPAGLIVGAVGALAAAYLLGSDYLDAYNPKQEAYNEAVNRAAPLVAELNRLKTEGNKADELAISLAEERSQAALLDLQTDLFRADAELRRLQAERDALNDPAATAGLGAVGGRTAIAATAKALDDDIALLELQIGGAVQAIANLEKALFGDLPAATDKAGDAVDAVGGKVADTGDEALDAKTKFDALAQAADALLDGIFPLRGEADDYTATLKKLATAHDAGAVSTTVYKAAISTLNLDLAKALAGTSNLAGAVDEFALAQGRYEELEKARATQSAALVKQLETEIITEALLNEVKQSGADIDQARLEQIAALIQQKAGLAATKEAAEDTLKQSEQAAKLVDKAFEEAARSIHRTIADELDDALRDGVDSFEDFGDRVLGILRRMVAEQGALAISNHVLPGLFPGFGGAGQAPGFAGGVAGAGTGAGVGAGGLGGLGGLTSLISGVQNLFSGGLTAGGSLFLNEGAGAAFGNLLNSTGLTTGLGAVPFAQAAGQLASPLGLAGGFAGTALAGLAGFNGSGNALVDTGLNLAGSYGGSLLGGAAASGALGSTLAGLGVAAGPIGIALGAFAGQALASVFEDEDFPFALAKIKVQDGELVPGFERRLDGGPIAEVRKLRDGLLETLQQTIDGLGGVVTGSGDALTSIGFASGRTGAIGKGFFGGHAGGFSVGASVVGEQTPERALSAALINALKQGAERGLIAGLSDSVVTALANIDVGNPEQAAALLDFAHNFDITIEAMLSGSRDLSSTVQGQVTQSVRELISHVEQFRENTVATGLDLDLANEALDQLVKRQLGLIDEELVGISAIETGLQRIEALRDLTSLDLDRLGLTRSGLEAGLVHLEDELRAGFEASFTAPARDAALLLQAQFDQTLRDAALLGITDPGALGAIRDRFTTEFRALYERTTAETRNANAALLADFERVNDRLAQFRDELLFDQSLTALSGADQLAEARARFEDVERRARLGDLDALEDLPDAGRLLLDLSKAFNADTSAFFSDRDLVVDALAAATTVTENQTDRLTTSIEIDQQQLTTLEEIRDALLAGNERTAGTGPTDAFEEQLLELAEEQARLRGLIAQGQTGSAKQMDDLLEEIRLLRREAS
ncbi:MAG: phage tail tape measure protein [Alphaproteobacteria bacterium]